MEYCKCDYVFHVFWYLVYKKKETVCDIIAFAIALLADVIRSNQSLVKTVCYFVQLRANKHPVEIGPATSEISRNKKRDKL